MSKLKIGDKVIVKENGKVGVVKGRDIVKLSDNKVRIEYIVKTDEGIDNWNSYLKDELEKVIPIKKEKKPITLVVNTSMGYKVTLVALVRNEYFLKDKVDEYGLFDYYYRKGKDLSIGYSIYNPNDVYDTELGVRIATHRAKKKPFCHMTSDFSGEFNQETIMALLKVKGEYIANNLSHFVQNNEQP